jgi:hypothetical protein
VQFGCTTITAIRAPGLQTAPKQDEALNVGG